MTEVTISVDDFIEKKTFASSVRLYLRLIFHTLAVCVFYFVNVYASYLWYLLLTDQFDVKDDRVLTIKWFSPLFLTNWNFMIQTIFLTVSLVYDLLEWSDRHESPLGWRLKKIRDVLFCSLVVPLTLFISSMFWVLYWLDRELVFPEIYDQLVPWWFNHCVHTNILIVLGVETLLQARRHPTNRKLELWLNGVVIVFYAVVYYSIYFLSHRWLYGVFGIMTWWQVCLYQLAIWISTFIFYFIQFPINRLFHKELPEDQKNVHEKPVDLEPWRLDLRNKQIENSSL